MTVFTSVEAEKNFSAVLDSAQKEGKVFIKVTDGTIFSLMPEKTIRSPFDIEGIHTDVTTEEILDCIRESRTA